MGLSGSRRREDDREAGRGDVGKILRFALAAAPEHPAPIAERDLEEAFELLEKAAEAAAASERRIQALEACLQAVAAEAEKARSQLQAAKARAVAAEVRAEEAEMRAQDAEAWLRRLHDLVRQRFSPARPARGETEPREAQAA
jgi:chromosome segregation ATPase